MSMNTASLAQAISLMSDVLSREISESESNDAKDIKDIKDIIINARLYDNLKVQATDFGQEVADELYNISIELEQALDQAESDADEGTAWPPFEGYDPAADEIVPLDDEDEVDEAESGNEEVDNSVKEAVDNDDRIPSFDSVTGSAGAYVGDIKTMDKKHRVTLGDVVNNIPVTDYICGDPMDEKAQIKVAAIAILEKKSAELEEKNNVLTYKIEELTDVIRASVTQIENLNASADVFVSEVESI